VCCSLYEIMSAFKTQGLILNVRMS
jgi:hypothetical protein